ncbi:MAG: class I SAM-dependent methyltransferase, partial [Odoribacter sp.]|nr:class I SAM-dependent methyltransferase [Odoribacter sp.]
MAFNRKQRLRDNIEAIQTAFVLDREQTTATAEERATLQKYCGFGGLKCILNPARELTDAVHWAKSDLELFPMTVELHRLIRENSRDDIEYKRFVDSLKASVLTAFYTPKEITDTIADVLHEHGIHPDRVLEPSAGVGAFVDAVLRNKPDADVMAFEKDLMTGKILKHLHSDQKVRIQGFEKIEAPFMKYFDLAISNIPFGDIAVFDPVFQNSKSFGRRSSQQAIHNYFFLKGLDAVRNGGIVAFITSQGVLNSTKVSVRNEMFRQADLVSAIRLPNNLFSDNAGTEVGSDLIILQKNLHKTELTQDEQLMTGIQTDMKTNLMDNAYFIRHPERIVHTSAKLDTDPYGKPAMVYLHEGKTAGIAGDLRRMLAEDCRSRLVMRSYSEAIQQPGVRETINVSTKTESPDVKLETVPPVHTAEIQDGKSQPMDYSEGVQLSLFSLWGMTEEVRKQETSSKKTAKPESKARRMPPKPQVQVTPKVATVTSETSIASTPKNRAEKGNPEVVYAAIDWDSNPPVNGFYETMINLTPERRMELRQRALRYQQEHLQKGSDKDISEAVIVPSSDNRQIRSTATEEKMGESGSVSKITTESVTATSGKIPTSLFPDLEIENQEAKVPDLSPRPFDGLLEPHHRDGSMVLDAFRNLGYLKDLTPYGAT